MPVTWKIRDSIIVIAVDGTGDDDVRAAIVSAIRSPQFRQGVALLLDMRLGQGNPASEDLRSLARWISKLPSRGVSPFCAIVVGPKQHHFGLARMVAIYAEFEGMDVEVFRDFDSAERWLHESGGKEKYRTA